MNPYPLHAIFASYGNDSIALIQWAFEEQLEDCYVIFSDTGWAAKSWGERLVKAEAWARSLGFRPVRTSSIGMEALVKTKKGWPRQGIQFCTSELKIRPAIAWLEEHDPLGMTFCLTGVRREESFNRRDYPCYQFPSPNHGGRVAWAPLVDVTKAERDALIGRAGFEPLPHRSKECGICINDNRDDMRSWSEDAVAEVERIERELGNTAKGKPRTMFRPYRHMGATGIREMQRWAKSERGEFDPDDGGARGCDSGWCGI